MAEGGDEERKRELDAETSSYKEAGDCGEARGLSGWQRSTRGAYVIDIPVEMRTITRQE